MKKVLDFLLFMHNESSGKFYTFYSPMDDYVNQRFYSGEAMLAFMIGYEMTGDVELLEATKQSFEFYKDYFVDEEKRPAFVPWHTNALYRLYQEDPDSRIADFIFESNDWLISMQNKDCDVPAHLGRFYDPNSPGMGVPHASSTGVYTEGLSYAYKLAKELGDVNRMESYKESMLLGVRSLMELQFSEEDVSSREDYDIILGGIRTSMDRTEIRIDNNQHTIMALLGVLEVFSEEEIDEFVKGNSQYECSFEG